MLYGTYHFPDDTDNETYGYSLTGKYRFYKNWAAYMRSTLAVFKQGGGRMSGSAVAMGVGWEPLTINSKNITKQRLNK